MKKILISVLLLVGTTFSTASAEVGFSVGVSGSIGLYKASGFETEGTEKHVSKNEELLGGMGSMFIEQNLGFLPGPFGRINVGYDQVLHEIKTGSASGVRSDLKGCVINTCTIVSPAITDSKANNQASATIDNINTLYVSVNLTDWLYVKAGNITSDVTSTEKLSTGSVYGDTTMDGSMYGAGIHFKTDSGVFTRFEVSETTFDGFTLKASNNTDNSVTLDDITSTSYKVSIGKTF